MLLQRFFPQVIAQRKEATEHSSNTHYCQFDSQVHARFKRLLCVPASKHSSAQLCYWQRTLRLQDGCRAPMMWPVISHICAMLSEATVSSPATKRLELHLEVRINCRFWSCGSHQCILQERAQVLVSVPGLKGSWSVLVSKSPV